MNHLEDIIEIELPNYFKNSSTLTVMNVFEEIKWAPNRIFFINTEQPVLRGDHAHRECIQVIYCNFGTLKVTCKDEKNKRVFTLIPNYKMLLIPAGIWSTLELSTNCSLTVLASSKFEEMDYIRDWDEFLIFRETN